MEEDEEIVEEEFVLSICWDSGTLAASFFNLSTLELHMVQEVTDLRPDCTQLKSLFRMITPSYLVISSGSKAFLEELLELFDTNDQTIDLNQYKVKKSSAANANKSNLSIYPFDRGHLEGLTKRIYDIDLPGMAKNCSSNDRQIFINSVFPMNQELFVISLGNLLRYLHDNFLKWRHIFLGLDKKLIITNVINTILQSQLLLDDTTYNSLNIFSNIYHPSSFKLQIRKDGVSLFNLLNHSCSAVGAQELKTILKQPTNDLNELNMRFNTIEWSMVKENEEHVVKMKQYLRNFININASFQRIINNHGKTNDWKSFKRTVYQVSSICELSASLPEESVRNTFIEQLAEYCRDGLSVNGILYSLDKIVDLEGINEKKRFIVKKSFDRNIDIKREELSELVEKFGGKSPDASLQKLHNALSAFQLVFFPEVGFLIGTTMKIDQLTLNQSIENDEIEIVLKTEEAIYFRTPNCKILNVQYDEKLAEIITIEMEVFQKLIQYINQNFAELAEICKLCAKLDCLFSFAKAAQIYQYVRPKITNDRKLEIVNGRHPLIEQMKQQYVPSTTLINTENNDFINIIRAPNSSGKSIYVKQLALICYMAHIGCFVPADKCDITLLHSIYTRIYTPESIYNNESAFMSDLQQMSKVVMNSTNRSLVLIDEFGKGTNYKDGIALLTATIEHFIERGKDFVPFIFITTHYPQVYDLLQTREFINLKTVATKKNDQDVFQSTYRIVHGVNEQVSTEFPESRKIIANIFDQKERDEELKIFNEAYNTSIKAFILCLARMKLRRNFVSYEFIKDVYSKVSIENFLNM